MHRKIAFIRLIIIAVLSCFAAEVKAQSAGVVRGSVTDANSAAIAAAKIALENGTSGYRQEAVSDGEGNFVFFNVPFGGYKLDVSQIGFRAVSREVRLNSNVPLQFNLILTTAELSERVTVTADEVSNVEPTRSDYLIDSLSVQNLTSALPSRQIENLVLSTPGIIKDGKGVFHARGAHNQSSYVIDGVPVSDQLTAIYANNFDARNVESISVQLGNIAPEFGNKTSAVIQVTTQSGLGRGQRLFGSIAGGGGSFNSGEASFKLGGENAKKTFGWFVSGANSFTARYLDPPYQNAVAVFDDGRTVTADGRGLNNTGNGQSFFARLDLAPNSRNFFKVNIIGARSRFDVANTPSQELSGQRQTQENRSLAVYPSWQYVFSSKWVTTLAPYLRLSTAVAAPSADDTPVTFGVSRHLSTVGAVANAAYAGNNHQLKFGIDAFLFPTSEAFDFQITDAGFNPLPPNSTATVNANGTVDFVFDASLTEAEVNALLINFNPNLIAYDRTILQQAAANNSIVNGAPGYFNTAQQRTGKQFSAYIQDTYTRGNLTIGGGVRFDHYRFLLVETAVSPRVGVAYRIAATNTAVRASYNRIVQTPSTENLLISGTAPAAALVNPLATDLFGPRTRQIPAERSHWFEIGARQQTGRFGQVDVAYYRKFINDLHDNDQFLNTTIIFPISISKGRVQGLDLRFDAARKAGFGGYFSIGFVQALVTPPFSGGLFLSGASVETFGGEEFTIDHDQKQTIQGALQYSSKRRNFFAQLLVRHDGGLVTGVSPADAPALAANPDTAAGLMLLDLSTDTVRVRPRTLVDASFAFDLLERENHRLRLQFDALNLTDKKGLYNYLSVFGGTNHIPARSFNARLQYDF